MAINPFVINGKEEVLAYGPIGHNPIRELMPLPLLLT